MKRFIILILICFLLCSATCRDEYTPEQKTYLSRETQDWGKGFFFSIGNSEISKIIDQLKEYSGISFSVLYVQTFELGKSISLGLIFIDFSVLAKEKDIIAFVMAHEVGHQVLRHFLVRKNGQADINYNTGQILAMEREADAYAARFLCKYGYDIEKVCNFAITIPFSDPEHGTWQERVELIKKVVENCK
ncbi:MAG: hypothetical protein PHE43_03970 [Candidatus Nanoarchaeia archaeon]|nr:hypothetical protein [Candidatus Nanoarchaeia archaeon]